MKKIFFLSLMILVSQTVLAQDDSYRRSCIARLDDALFKNEQLKIENARLREEIAYLGQERALRFKILAKGKIIRSLFLENSNCVEDKVW